MVAFGYYFKMGRSGKKGYDEGCALVLKLGCGYNGRKEERNFGPLNYIFRRDHGNTVVIIMFHAASKRHKKDHVMQGGY